ncbi:hypothetical protein BpHYR1_053856 [Brachionus plicatilis]|uniref:Uncharacterized protein n=1 Tax=Brachionus plicatilis TaxID=10195 RepID=A0A3M7Q5H0_BRAPC|nr:hypothetical protein BpHYR1_053856 [Brachionus plicatilis]
MFVLINNLLGNQITASTIHEAKTTIAAAGSEKKEDLEWFLQDCPNLRHLLNKQFPNKSLSLIFSLPVFVALHWQYVLRKFLHEMFLHHHCK